MEAVCERADRTQLRAAKVDGSTLKHLRKGSWIRLLARRARGTDFEPHDARNCAVRPAARAD